LLAGIVVSSLLAVWAKRAENEATGQRIVAEAAEQEAVAQRDRAEANFAEARRQREQSDVNLFRSLIGEARAIREARGSGYRAQAFKRLEQASRLQIAEKDITELRHEAGACLGDFVGLEPTDWKVPPNTEFAGLDLHPGSELLAIALSAQTTSEVLIRNIVTGQQVARFPSRLAPFCSVKFSVDGERLFAGKPTGTVEVWQVNADGEWVCAKTLVTAPQPGGFVTPSPLFPFFVAPWEFPPISRLAISPDGTRLAASFGGAPTNLVPGIMVWNLVDGSPASAFFAADALSARTSWQGGLAFSPRGELLAIGFNRDNFDGVLVWDVETRKVKQALRPDLGAVGNVCFSADGKHLACAGYQGVALFDTVDWERRLFVRGDFPFTVAFSPDSRLLAIPAPESGVIRLWNITTNREVTLPWMRDPGGKRFVSFTRDGKRLVSAGSTSARVWNLAGAAEKLTLPGHRGGVPGLAFSPDGKLLASTGKDNTVRLWDPVTGKIIRELRGFNGPTQSVAFHADGRFLATTEYTYTGEVKVWDVQSGQELSTDPHDPGPATYGNGVFSTDGKYFMVCGERGVRIWRVVHVSPREDGRVGMSFKEVARPTRTYANSACFSPDCKLAAWTDGDQVSVWDLATGQKKTWPARVFAFLALSFLPDSRHLALVNWNKGKIEVRDATSGQVTTTFGKKELIFGESIHTALSPDGALLAVGGDKAVTVWDMNKRELLFALPEEPGTIWSLAWSPDKSLLAVGTSTGGLVVWNLPRIKTELSRIGLGW
jgi:WD40 repeat protein